MRAVAQLAVAGASAAVTTGANVALRRSIPGGSARWDRANYKGDPVSLLEGPAVVAGLVAGTVVTAPASWPRRVVLAAAFATVAAIGAYDDVQQATTTKGLRGHLRALGRGEVTSGSLKIVAFGGAGVLCAAALRSARTAATGRSVLLDAALVAGTANLVNLLDLRPGRALKAVTMAAAVGTGGRGAGLAAPVLGAALAALPDDVSGRTMLGDCGANSLGAALGCVAVASARPRTRWTALGVVTGLTLVSERVSFGAVIERHPWLHHVDQWGRTAEIEAVAPRP